MDSQSQTQQQQQAKPTIQEIRENIKATNPNPNDAIASNAMMWRTVFNTWYVSWIRSCAPFMAEPVKKALLELADDLSK